MAGGQQITVGQGSVTYSTGAASEAATGSAATTATGDVAKNRLHPLRSRKPTGGSASFALSGVASSLAGGSFVAVPQIATSGQAAAFTAGSVGRSATIAQSGSAIQSSTGAVFGNAGTSFATFSLISGTTNSAAPFAFGHAFKQGDVPSGQIASGNSASWQCSPLTYWPDGSLKHAIVAGRANVTNGGTTAISLSVAANPGGTALTEANLAAALPTVTIAAGAHTTTLGSLVGTAALHRTVCSGPVMSNWIYRQAVTASAYLVIWVDVRLYVGGHIEIFPWIENGYLTTAGSNESRTYSVTIAGVSRFSQVIDVKHRTRVPLVTGSTFSYWVGTDPQITPKHDREYLTSTKLVPNYGWTNPSATTLNNLPQTYTPNTLAGIGVAMGDAGSSASLINSRQALYITSNGDARAYRSAVVFGLSGGSWSTHYRDSSTNEPFLFSSYPSADLDSGGTPTIPSGSGGENGTAVTTHQPSYGYLPFLITGRWWFLDESMFWTTYNYLKGAAGSRRGWTEYATAPYLFSDGSAGVIDPRNGGYANRGAGWSIRTLAQTLTLCPTTHSLYTGLKTAWENNTDFYKQTFVDGTFAPGWVSPQGYLGAYQMLTGPGGSTAWWTSVWMNLFSVQSWGFASDIGLPQSAASLTRHLAVRDHAYKQIVQRAGDGVGGNPNWRRLAIYEAPVGTTAWVPTTWFTAAQTYAEYVLRYGINASLPATAGLTLKEHTTDTDITTTESTSAVGPDHDQIGYGSMGLAALAYAVDHGASGATDAMARIVGASNYAVAFSGLNDRPGHGISPRQLPTWRQGQEVNAWRELSGSSLSLLSTLSPAGSDAPQGKIDAWNGLAADTRTSDLISTGNGGHDNYWGNEVDRIRLTDNAPAWTRITTSSLSASVTDTDLVSQDYYSDGKPASHHTYHGQICIESLDKVLRFPGGSKSKIGYPSQAITGWGITAGAWDGVATWGSQTSPVTAQGDSQSYAKHPTTENVYGWFGNSGLYRWNKGTPGTWTLLVSGGSIPTKVYQSAAACDPSRGTAGQVFFIGAGDPVGSVCHKYDIGTNTFSAITLTGTDIKSNRGMGLVYVAATDKFYACVGSSGGSSVYVITPTSGTSWACSLLSTTGGSGLPSVTSIPQNAGNPYTKFQYFPALGGVAYLPRWSANVWFLRLH
jgi:hypothetical protein